jgi:hypothetical protein
LTQAADWFLIEKTPRSARVNMSAYIGACETPQVGKTYYIVNVAHGKLLDTHGAGVKVWNNNGRSVLEVVTQNTSEFRGNLHWTVHQCPHQADAVYFVNENHKAFMDTHGQHVQVWNNSGRTVATVIRENTSSSAGNLRWKVRQCPHQNGVFYIINTGHSAFLDTHGNEVWVWNNGGKNEATIIAENESGNLRWCFIDVRKQNRFGCALGVFGVACQRLEEWRQLCSSFPTPISPGLQDLVRAQVYDPLHDEYTPVFRAYTLESPLYRAANGDLLRDNLANSGAASFVHALRRAIYDRCQRGDNVRSGKVWRGMELETESLQAYQIGQKFLWPNFVSTTTDESQAFPGNVLFEIDLEGHGVTFAVDIGADSRFPGESEVLLYPYSGYEVLDRIENHIDCTGTARTLIKLRTYDTLAIDESAGGLDMAEWSDLKNAIGLS